MKQHNRQSVTITVSLRLLATLLTPVLILGILLIGLPAVVGAQGPDQGISVQSLVSTAFTYQGRLLDNANPVNDTCDFYGILYDAQTNGNDVGRDTTTSDVNDGYFSLLFDFGSDVFKGDALWLQIWVRCPSGTGDYTNLDPLVALTAVPYAHSLRPGAVISSSGTALNIRTSGNSGYALSVKADATTGNVSGVYGETKAPNGAGVIGLNTGDSAGYGVYGTASSETGVGVYGEAADASTLSDVSYGGYFVANGWGDIGVYGEVKWPDSGAAGVYGKSSHPNNYGVYSDGNAHVSGDLTWKAKTSYVSVPAAAFIPTRLGDTPVVVDPHYVNTGESLAIFASSAPLRDYVAPVQLPHGAEVTTMSFHYGTTVSTDAAVGLYRKGQEQMAYAAISDPESHVTKDTTIDYEMVDNLNNTYYLLATLDQGVLLENIVIEYTITQPY